jgi:hypothetical protein
MVRSIKVALEWSGFLPRGDHAIPIRSTNTICVVCFARDVIHFSKLRLGINISNRNQPDQLELLDTNYYRR